MAIREKYGYAESSNLRATKAGHIFDVVQSGVALENGMPVKLGELDEILELRKVTAPAKGDPIVLVLSALLAYDDSTSEAKQEWYYRREIGQAARAYAIEPEDRFAIASYMIKPASSALKAGNTVVVNTSVTGKQFYEEVAVSADSTTLAQYGFAARIEGIENKGELTLVRLRVIQNKAIA